MRVDVYDVADPKYQITEPDGQVRQWGQSLASWRTRLGGDEGVVTDPAVGGEHKLSLKPYAHLDPERTYLALSFGFIPEPSARRSYKEEEALKDLTLEDLARIDASLDPKLRALILEGFYEDFKASDMEMPDDTTTDTPHS